MADHIPFITSEDACDYVKNYYADSTLVRVPLDRANKFIPKLPSQMKIWLDPGVDGLGDLDAHHSANNGNNSWCKFIKTLDCHDKIADALFQASPTKSEVQKFVKVVLDRCVAHKPTWITVPQLPAGTGVSRNKINRALAKATGDWKSTSNFSGHLILPLVFTHQNQIKGKTQRNPRVKHAEQCYHEAKADGFWTVDASLLDDSGSKTLREKRFPSIINLHEELNSRIASKIRVAGPYWGLNLVLWARGLVDYPVIGIGLGYRYYLPGGTAKQPSARLALTPLRRRASVAQLKTWLNKVIGELGASHPARLEFANLAKQFHVVSSRERAREQVAKFYKQWFDAIAVTPQEGRSMAIYQDLSAAYVLGKSLPNMGSNEKTARRPEAVVEPLMLSCL